MKVTPSRRAGSLSGKSIPFTIGSIKRIRINRHWNFELEDGGGGAHTIYRYKRRELQRRRSSRQPLNYCFSSHSFFGSKGISATISGGWKKELDALIDRFNLPFNTMSLQIEPLSTTPPAPGGGHRPGGGPGGGGERRWLV